MRVKRHGSLHEKNSFLQTDGSMFIAGFSWDLNTAPYHWFVFESLKKSHCARHQRKERLSDCIMSENWTCSRAFHLFVSFGKRCFEKSSTIFWKDVECLTVNIWVFSARILMSSLSNLDEGPPTPLQISSHCRIVGNFQYPLVEIHYLSSIDCSRAHFHWSILAFRRIELSLL